MPSPRKGGTTPIRRRRKPRAGPGPRRLSPAAVASPPPSPKPPQAAQLARRGPPLPSASTPESDSSWADTSDTSILSSDGSGSSRGCCQLFSTSPCSPCSSSSSSEDSSTHGTSGSDGDDSSDSGEDDEEDGGPGSRPKGGGMSPKVRGRSWSRRGARQRGGSVLCRYCGKRGYGVMKMVMSCCQRAVAAHIDGTLMSAPETSDVGSCSPPPQGNDLGLGTSSAIFSPASIASSQSPCPRYNWSPCSSDSSSSTLSEDAADGGPSSSGDDADVECKSIATLPPPLQLLHCGGHVAVN